MLERRRPRFETEFEIPMVFHRLKASSPDVYSSISGEEKFTRNDKALWLLITEGCSGAKNAIT